MHLYRKDSPNSISKTTATRKGVTTMYSNAKKYTLGLFFILIAACTLCGCKGNPKNFTVDTMTITLTDSFKESKMDGFKAYIVSDDVTFSVKTENASDLEYQGYEIAGLKDYAKEICGLNNISSDKLEQRNNYYYFSNSQTVSGAKYTYLHCMFQQGSNYWICEFVCKARQFDSLEASMLKWADSITFE